MPLILDLKPIEKPLSVISENKNFLNDLKLHGLKQAKIRKIFDSWKRSRAVYVADRNHPETKIALSKMRDRQKKLSRASAKMTACLSDELISKRTKKILEAEKEAIKQSRDNGIIEDPGGSILSWTFVHGKMKWPEPKRAKSVKQMIGLKILDLHNYIKPIMDRTNRDILRDRNYTRADIFGFIAELLSKTYQLNLLKKDRITPREVRSFFDNSTRVK